jgi:all-trans-retinol dehydrogenase (NAD+)
MPNIRAQRILITGGGHGLGRALARRFSRAGAFVAISDRDAARAHAVAGELREAGGTALALALDVTDDRAIAAAQTILAAEFGPLDILINNAGIVHGGPFLDVSIEHHRATIAVNFDGLVAVTHAFLPELLRRPEAAIVNLASASAFVAMPHGTTYAASKSAVLSFTDSLREELRQSGHRHVHLLAVCPSFIDTGMFAGARPPLKIPMLAPDAVAGAIIQALDRRRELLIVPGSVRWLWRLCRALPRPVFRWLCRRLGVADCMADCRGAEH